MAALRFRRFGQREARLEEFALDVDGWLPLLPVVSWPELTGEMLADVVRRKEATAGSLDSWGWREMKALPVACYDQTARILSVEEFGVWPEGWLDAYIAMIPKANGDATLLVSVKSFPPTTENWLRKLYVYSMNNNTSTEDKHETNHINNKYNDTNTDTRKLHNL